MFKNFIQLKSLRVLSLGLMLGFAGMAAQAQNQAPTVSFNYPAQNTVFPAHALVEISTIPQDADGTIQRVEYRSVVNSYVNTQYGPPYKYNMGINVAPGTYTFRAITYDNLGAASAEATVTFTVAPDPEQVQKPTVVFNSPANGTVIPVSAATYFEIAATPYASDGRLGLPGTISKVEYRDQNGVLRGTSYGPPYKIGIQNLPAGTYTFSAVAFNMQNVASDPASLSLTIAANRPPAVTFTAPAKNSVYPYNTSVKLVADAIDPDNNLARVEFYNQAGTLVGTDNSAPYEYTTGALTAGNYIFTTVAFDAAGLSSNTASVNFTINPASNCTAAQWNANTAYNSGQVVQYAGIRYQANWWTQNDRPDLNNGASGSGKPWTSLGICNARVEAAEALSSISVYPNPATDVLNINGIAEIVEISNLAGEVLLSANNATTLNVSSLPAGLYTVKIQTSGTNTTQKFVKQ